MVRLLLFVVGFLIISSGIKFIFDYKMEISMFITLCFATIIVAVFALIGALAIGVYIVYAITLISLAFCLYYVVKNFSKINDIFLEIFTPGTIILLIATFAYFLVVRDKVLIYRDEATAWVITVRHMFTRGEFVSYTTHPNIMAFFSYLFTKVVGYTEGNIFISKWFFVWTCLVLPISDLSWKDWKKAFIYAIGAYCTISIINSDPVYYMDMPLGVVAGAICARWSISKINKKDYVWLILGFIILISIKEELGYVISGLVALYITSCSLLRYFNSKNKKLDLFATISHAALYLIIFIYMLMSDSLGDMIKALIAKIGYLYLALGIIFLLAVFIGMFFVFRLIKKKLSEIEIPKTIKNISIGAIILVICLGIYKVNGLIYSSVSFEQQNIFYNAINKAWSKGYFGKDVYILVGLAIILIAITCMLLLKKKASKILSVQTFFMLLVIAGYAYTLCWGYVFTPSFTSGATLMQFHRYYGSVYILAGIWLLGRILDNDLKYKFKHGAIIIGLIILSVMIKEFPTPGTVLYGNMENYRYSVTYGLRANLDEDSKFISENVDDGNILIIAQPENNEWDSFSAISWIRYNLLPMLAKGTAITEEQEYLDGFLSSTIDAEGLKEHIIDKGYTYVYIYSSDDYFMENYSYLFEPSGDEEYIIKTLYKVTPKSETFCTLIAVE